MEKAEKNLGGVDAESPRPAQEPKLSPCPLCGSPRKRSREELGYDPVEHEKNMQWLKEREIERTNATPKPSDPNALIRPA